MSHDRPRSVDPRAFRDVVANFCTGVAIITAVDAAGPMGMTAQSFVSLSLAPLLVGVSFARTSHTWPRIRKSGRFCVNILSEEQAALCQRFATSGGEKFQGVEWSPCASGLPVIAGSLAFISCDIEWERDAGDHVFVAGAVKEIGALQPERRPLLFFRGMLTGPAAPSPALARAQ